MEGRPKQRFGMTGLREGKDGKRRKDLHQGRLMEWEPWMARYPHRGDGGGGVWGGGYPMGENGGSRSGRSVSGM